MRISKASHQHKKTSLWDGNQADAEPVLTTPDILNKATATIRASLGANSPRNIWTALGQHLHKHISLLKAVRIPGFGTVGLNQDNELIFVQDPVFLHMTRLCLASRKRGNCVQPSLAHSESVLDINENELAAEHLQNCSKDLVKSVISSVLAWVVSWAKEGQKMRLSLLPVGEWICDGESVEFCFSESFCNEINLQKARNEEAQGAISSDSEVNNQVEGSGATGGQSTVASLPQCSVEATALLEFHSGKESVTVDTSVATVKDTAIRSGSPVERSRYKLRAPTLSSIAKQMPPHGQQRRRKDVEAKQSLRNNKHTTIPSQKHAITRGETQKTQEVVSTFTPDQLEAVVNDRIAVTKTAHPVKNRICKNNQQENTYSGPGGHQLDVIFRLRKRISNRSGEALQGLNAVVSVLRYLKTSAISCTQLNLSMRKLGVKISSSELNEIAVAFRHDKRGLIDTKKLLDALRGPPLAATRLELVSKAFHRMDPTGNGAVCIDEMIKHYDVGFLPQVRDGKQSRLEALTAFLQEWAGITPNANTITFDTFVMYYHNVSACISNDTEFARLMQHAWHLSEENNDVKKPHQEEFSTSVSSTPSAPMPLSHQDVSPSNCPKNIMTAKPAFKGDAPPSEIWSYLRLLLLFPQQCQNSVNTWPTQDSMCRRLGANRILGDGNEVMNLKAFAQSLAILDKRLTQKEAYDLSRFVAACCAKEFGSSETIVMKSLYRMLMTTLDEQAGGELFSDINYIEYYASRAIERIKARVIKNKAGTSEGEMSPPVDLGILEKWLHLSSSNGDTLLMKYELKSGLQKVGIDISYQDLDYIFAYFDVDRLGYISCDVIMEGLRCESDVPLKLAKPQEKSSANSEVKPMNAAIDNEEPRPTYTAVSLAMNHRKRQVAKREPLPNFRRRNLIHRAIWDQSVKPETAKSGELEPERRRRYLAARIIQTTFRVFRARQIAAQLRRKAAAKKHRLNALSQERQQLLVKKKANRVALPSAYGF